MATVPVGELFDEPTLEPHERPGYHKLSLMNGLLIGASLALGSWGQEVLRLVGLPVENAYTSLLLGSLTLLLICGLTGWLTGYAAKAWLTVLLWLGTAVLCALIIGYQPYIGRTVAEWLADTRAWGLPIYSAETVTRSGLILGGLAIIIVLTILALMQASRLEQAVIELGDNGRMSARSWFILLLPMPFVALVAFLTSSVQINPAAQAASGVFTAIEVARTTEGDLFQQGIRDGINYGALNAVRDQLTENYTLRVGEINPNSSQTFILADFDSGAWVNCRTLADQLSFCYDALPPYSIGLASLISGEPPPEDCRTCSIRTTDEWVAWLQGQSAALGPDPQIERLAQWGGYVLMRVASADGDHAIQCRFDKMSPVQLETCWEE